MMWFDDHFKDGILIKRWSYKSLVNSEANWVANGHFINLGDPLSHLGYVY